MEYDFKFGMNTLNYMLIKGLEEMKADRLDCMAYNINLDFILQLFHKYPHLSKVKLYSNSQSLYFSSNNRDKIYKLFEKEKIEIYHISNNINIIHAKLYRFLKGDKILFGAIGSPNCTNHSNQSFESLLLIYDDVLTKKMWEEVKNACILYGIGENSTIPKHILDTYQSDIEIGDKYINGLWAHQTAVLEWMVKRNNSIINIPTGCGKTKIAMTYLEYLFDTKDNMTCIVLVPKKVLIEQWLNLLKYKNISCYELGVNFDGIGEYFAYPEKKAIVTLYSRFNNLHKKICSKLNVLKPNVLVIADECHNLYENLDIFEVFNENLQKMGLLTYNIGLSATIDSFNTDNVDRYLSLMGGEENRYEITLQSFYSHWNDLNSSPSLKPIKYNPIKYCLSEEEMVEYNELSKKVGMQSHMTNISNESNFGAAIKRAMWVRSLSGGIETLKKFIEKNIESFNEENTIIFVQTSEIAEQIRDYLTSQSGWNNYSSAYVYDSKHNSKHLQYSLQQFKDNNGFCLISVFMLSEGFDIPKISRVILHGSRKSQRDWIQKIGRAIRYDRINTESIAEIIDIVFCSPDEEPLTIEKERFEILQSISV